VDRRTAETIVLGQHCAPAGNHRHHGPWTGQPQNNAMFDPPRGLMARVGAAAGALLSTNAGIGNTTIGGILPLPGLPLTMYA
jgi:hypothetical protein